MNTWEAAFTEQIRLCRAEADAQQQWRDSTGDADASPEKYASAARWAMAARTLYMEKEKLMLAEIADAMEALGAEDVFNQAQHLRNNDAQGLTAW